MDSDVVVIGAGAAGLAAALRLAERSVRVVLLEGSDRVGGRVRWHSVGAGEVPAELGAEFIHGAAPETSAFLHEAGLGSVRTDGPSWTCSADGGLRVTDDDGAVDDIFGRLDPQGGDESVTAFLDRFDDDAQLRERARQARAFVEGFEAADPALASAHAIADEIRSGVDATSSRPVGGYAPLFEHLVARCERVGVDLRLGATVQRVGWEPGRVTVGVRTQRDDPVELRARCAVVTVPVGVLQQRGGATPLSFMPPLPPAKTAALGRLAMGHVVRVVLQFRTPFWRSLDGGRYGAAAFFRCEGGTVFHAFWPQGVPRGRTIAAWVGGPRATAMHGSSVEVRIEQARDAFGAMLGERELTRREFVAGFTHDWSADPLACGAYSYVTTGAGASTARGALGAPVEQTLFFAGEATATDGQGGTVSGAFASGIRAAGEIVRALAPAHPEQVT